jgi:hypothetical protein
MANITIPNLPQAVSIDGSEQLLGVQSGTSKSITTGQIVSLANGSGGSLPFPVSIGGTGNTTFDTYGVLYGDGTNPVESITPPTGSNYILVASPGTVPAWQENIPVTAGVNSINFGSTGLTPNTATEGVVTVEGTLVAASGGTGQSSYTIGDLLYASSSTALSKLADVATGSVLISGGVGVAPSYSASPTLTTSLTTPLLIGGTTASSALTLQSTSGVGTTDSIAFKVGNNGATTAMTINSDGNVGIGTTALTVTALRVSKSITGSTTAQSIRSDGAIQTDVTGNATYFQSATSMASGTLSNLYSFDANQSTIGATVTNQVGFRSAQTLIGAASNYGFLASNTAAVTAGKTAYGYYSDIDIATGGGTTYGFYANGTATNYFGGNVGIGTTSLTGYSLRAAKNITGDTTAYGVFSDGIIQSDVTANAYYYGTSASAVSGTLSTLRHYHARQASIGSATVTTQYGFVTDDSLIGATNNYAFLAGNTAAVTAGKTAYGFYSAVNTATGGGTTYGFYAAGTADNYFNGAVTLGTPLAVSSGGTGATTSNAALTNLTTFTSTATASGTTVLTNTSTYFQFFTGTLTQTITLPVTSTLGTGWTFHIVNNSTGDLTVNSSGGNLVITGLPGTTVMVTCIGTALTTAADWEAGYTDFTTATGTGSVVLSSNPTFTTTLNANGISASLVSSTTITGTGAGYQNMVVQITGTSASYSLPAALQVGGARFKVTLVGGGGQGGGTAATAGQEGGGGGGGATIVVFLSYASGQNTLTYTVGPGGSGAGTNAAGTAGTASSIIYNSVTYTANGGGGGPTAATTGSGVGGAASGGTLNISGQNGGAGGTEAATNSVIGSGGDSSFGFGAQAPSATGTGTAATSGFGGGGSGGHNSATATARAGGAGAAGVVIIEY